MEEAYGALAVLALVVVFLARGGIPERIRSPRLGLLNLKGASAAAMLAQDRYALSAMFTATEESESAPPHCDVLFIYCDIEEDGRLAGTARGLRDLIGDAGARIVVVASESDGKRAAAAVQLAAAVGRSAKIAADRRANLVLTLDRKGAVFSAFFVRLFAQMMKGVAMPRAWVKLAPQIPGHTHAECPDAIFLAEAGQLAFK